MFVLQQSQIPTVNVKRRDRTPPCSASSGLFVDDYSAFLPSEPPKFTTLRKKLRI
ncbi:MAG: hypothetical protein HC815_16180 [Richelia sp. RM1_1_1]|nr:hypothetical protein [Richelia sp. SM1_7_0]NJN09435.1 hypothetical protein [Richelia sp. RM1_1_1]